MEVLSTARHGDDELRSGAEPNRLDGTGLAMEKLGVVLNRNAKARKEKNGIKMTRIGIEMGRVESRCQGGARRGTEWTCGGRATKRGARMGQGKDAN